MHEPIPYKTDDAIGALCLYLAGIPEFRPPTNTFDELKLKRLNYGGMELLEAGQAAWKRCERGHVEYWFEKTDELPYFLDAYKDQVARIESDTADEDGGAHVRDIMHRAAEPNENGKKMDEREAVMRIACTVLKGRIAFVNRWKERAPHLRINAPGQAVKTGDATTFPGFLWFPINLPESKLRELGVL